MRALYVAFALAVLPACPARAPVGVETRWLQPTSASTCSNQCAYLGLTLDSVVIMASRIGCVCRPAPAQAPAGAPGAAVGGMSAILDDEAAAVASQNSSSSTKKH